MKLLAKDLRNNSIEELEKNLVDAKSEMLQIRQKKQSAILKPNELRNGRRNVAVILTIIREKKYQQLLEK
ncbi:Ribosomal L29 protein, partial [Spraguea lophii 42_110]